MNVIKLLFLSVCLSTSVYCWEDHPDSDGPKENGNYCEPANVDRESFNPGREGYPYDAEGPTYRETTRIPRWPYDEFGIPDRDK
jgi:hypothetical protein